MTHRKHSHAFGTITLTVTACLLLWGFQLPAWAGDATQVEPLALRKIMQELGRNMQAITGAISQEEWVQVVQLAPKVAAHPEPPLTEKMRILAYLGADATKFRGTVAKLAMRQPFVLFKGLTFQKLCLPGAFRPGDHHNKMLRLGLCVVHASPQYL